MTIDIDTSITECNHDENASVTASRRRHGRQRKMHVGLLYGVVQAFVIGHSCAPTHRRAATVTLSGGDWMFVDVRGATNGESRELEAIVDPFGRRLLVGEEDWHRVASPEGLMTLDVAARNGSLMVLIPSTTCTGSQATVVRVTEVSAPSARLVGVGRCLVDGVAGKTPRLRVRVRPRPDSLLEGAALARAREVAATITELWERCLQLFQRLQELQLKAKLRSLGSGASSALLSIPLEQQLELTQGSSAERSVERPTSARAAACGIDEALSAAVRLTEVVRRALSEQPDDALAIAPPTELESDAAPMRSAELSSPQLSLFSFVALRLTRESAEDPDDFLEIQPDPRAPTIRQGEGVDTLSRLELCRTRLEVRASAMQAQVSLLALMEPTEES